MDATVPEAPEDHQYMPRRAPQGRSSRGRSSRAVGYYYSMLSMDRGAPRDVAPLVRRPIPQALSLGLPLLEETTPCWQ